MTVNDARKVLNIHEGAARRQIDTAYLLNRDHLMLRARFETCPQHRDQAHQALALLNEAYQALTGVSAPPHGANNQVKMSDSAVNIPRASLYGKVTSPPPNKSTKHIDWLGILRTFKPACNPENIAASLICIAMFIVSLVILACVQR